ncbi:MAG TPA: BadF/BadG/BcrA/BcrD ATPase family protein [Methylomirabilota bacterium]|jgi:N-acetylglucosamine kinase-like BadF-type ATPase|nr:BadF/BadG/BcrA/BcrD ATPase family protein [Methylomirabilota bacterium]
MTCPLVVGADVGATWIRLVARRGPRRIGAFRTSACQGDDLGTFFPWAFRVRGWRDVAALVIGSRGIWTTAERRAVARRVARAARRIEVLSDAQVAHLGALGVGAGILILAGTGSIVIGRDREGRWARGGGFGPLLGDEGSGFWLGRAWLRATTQGEDFMPARRLIQSPDPVRRIAALAPSVIARARRGDRRARSIVAEGQRHLAALAGDVARRLRLPAPIAVSWAGSVVEDAWYRAGLKRALRRAGVRARWQAPAMGPVEAAALRAVEIARRRHE